MSIDTNSMDEQGILLVGEKSIVAQVVELRHPSMQHAFDVAEPITAASLWGVLRSYPIEAVLLSYTDPVYVAVLFNDPDEDCGYYRIDMAEYQKFLDFYCTKGPMPKFDWRQEGF